MGGSQAASEVGRAVYGAQSLRHERAGEGENDLASSRRLTQWLSGCSRLCTITTKNSSYINRTVTATSPGFKGTFLGQLFHFRFADTRSTTLKFAQVQSPHRPKDKLLVDHASYPGMIMLENPNEAQRRVMYAGVSPVHVHSENPTPIMHSYFSMKKNFASQSKLMFVACHNEGMK